MRRNTRKIYYGKIGVGGDSPISVQSMTNTDTRDVLSTVNQIKRLQDEGCDIIRVAVPDNESALAISDIKKQIKIPLIADVHFDYRLGIESVKNGVDGLRINPGNIGGKTRVREVVKYCKEYKVPIRVGVNSGSINEVYLNKYKGVNVDSIVESALEHVRILEDLDFFDTVISLKSSDIRLTVDSYNRISEIVDYPLHLGITEAGTIWNGTIKSAIGIGSMLLNGVGDTIRVSLTGDPLEEVKVGKQILRSLGILKDKVEIISCPTCARTQINLEKIANDAEKALKDLNKPLKVAIMGCAVNGPGEAKEADIGIAGGLGSGLIFKEGQIIKKVKEEDLLEELINEIKKL